MRRWSIKPYRSNPHRSSSTSSGPATLTRLESHLSKSKSHRSTTTIQTADHGEIKNQTSSRKLRECAELYTFKEWERFINKKLISKNSIKF